MHPARLINLRDLFLVTNLKMQRTNFNTMMNFVDVISSPALVQTMFITAACVLFFNIFVYHVNNFTPVSQ